MHEHEPRIDPFLLTAPRTVLLPYIGSAAEKTRRRMAELECLAATDVLAGRRPANVLHR